MSAHAPATHEPVFVGPAREKLEALFPRYPTRQACLLPALWIVMEERGWIKSDWGVSEHNRRARFYKLTRKGQKQLEAERANWNRVSKAVTKILQAT